MSYDKVFMDFFVLSATVQSGDSSTLRVEIDDPAVQAIEFLLFDEARNKW